MAVSIEGELNEDDRKWIKENAPSGIVEECDGTTGVHKTIFNDNSEGLCFKLYYEKK